MGSFQRDTTIAISIETLQELDDTLVHRKLAILLKTGRNRVKRVMHTYGLAARRRRQKYIYPGKAAQTAPHVVRELEPDSQQHVVFSDIFEVRLADQSRVRGCLASAPVRSWVWLSITMCERIWSPASLRH